MTPQPSTWLIGNGELLALFRVFLNKQAAVYKLRFNNNNNNNNDDDDTVTSFLN